MLKDVLNERFGPDVEIVSTNVDEINWIRSTENLFDEFPEGEQEAIFRLSEEYKRNEPYAHIVDYDLSEDGTAVDVYTIRTDFAQIQHMRGKSSVESSKKPRILSANGFYTTSDGVVILRKRADDLATYAGCFHIVGGGANPKSDRSPFDVLLREGCEELGVYMDEFDHSSISLIGLSREPPTGFEQILYTVPLNLSLDEIIKRKESNEGKNCYVKEHLLGDFLVNNWENFVPTGLTHCLLSESKKPEGDERVKRILKDTRDKLFAKH
ncbi:MAG: hypothetical protein GOU97_01920 [Nanoarchaeota archaeon]|nr:hypothetical protein [Nanoarchaeota archaeon]